MGWRSNKGSRAKQGVVAERQGNRQACGGVVDGWMEKKSMLAKGRKDDDFKDGGQTGMWTGVWMGESKGLRVFGAAPQSRPRLQSWVATAFTRHIHKGHKRAL
ncbi:hypothetical protein E2C01_083090 [Portunus trituberculatus]|uniref:Uncharacterized protein n=1 Tax=Portunus trituberculatus TaxID=210409 RepID=A0A5B7J101_PORTR|nr:hypothetical protein [Portunus trituberculatus]